MLWTMKSAKAKNKRGASKAPPRVSRQMKTGERRSRHVAASYPLPSLLFPKNSSLLAALPERLRDDWPTLSKILQQALLGGLRSVQLPAHGKSAAAVLARLYVEDAFDAEPAGQSQRRALLGDLDTPQGMAMFPRHFLDEHMLLFVSSMFRSAERMVARMPAVSRLMDFTPLRTKYGGDARRLWRLYAACHARRSEVDAGWAQELLRADVAWAGVSGACLAQLGRLQTLSQGPKGDAKEMARQRLRWIFHEGSKDRARAGSRASPAELDWNLSRCLGAMFAAVATASGTMATEEVETYLNDVAGELLDVIPKGYRPAPETESSVDEANGEAARRLRLRVSPDEQGTILDAGMFASTTLGARVTRWMRMPDPPPS